MVLTVNSDGSQLRSFEVYDAVLSRKSLGRWCAISSSRSDAGCRWTLGSVNVFAVVDTLCLTFIHMSFCHCQFLLEPAH